MMLARAIQRLHATTLMDLPRARNCTPAIVGMMPLLIESEAPGPVLAGGHDVVNGKAIEAATHKLL